MSEAEQKAQTHEHINTICDCVRKGLEVVAEAFTPPEAAGKHFREAHIEMLRGFRALIDHRIEHLSRAKSTGTRVVVE